LFFFTSSIFVCLLFVAISLLLPYVLVSKGYQKPLATFPRENLANVCNVILFENYAEKLFLFAERNTTSRNCIKKIF